MCGGARMASGRQIAPDAKWDWTGPLHQYGGWSIATSQHHGLGSHAVTRRWTLLLLASLALIILVTRTGGAQTVPPPAPLLKVALAIDPPFVTQTDTGFGGFAVELWEGIAAKLNLKYEYRVIQYTPDLLRSMTNGEADIIVANLTITHDRLLHMDFTQPWFDSGLRIMISRDRQTGMRALLTTLSDSNHLRVYMWIVIVVLGATIILTLIDRLFDPDFPREWHNGLAHSFYHVMSVITSGKTNHKELFGSLGRVLSAVWMIAGVTVVAYITSSMTTFMTVSALTSQIKSVADLPGKTVGTIRGIAAELVAKDLGVSIRSFDTLDAAVQALVAQRIAAIMGEAPVLEYYGNTHLDLPIATVGPLFHPNKYGFALPIGSQLTRLVNQQIVAAVENGALQRLRTKYFGNED
jgi:ABC-type amino acid transport substrate-binding protein